MIVRFQNSSFNGLIIHLLLVIIPVIYYSLEFITSSPLRSEAFVSSSFGASFFPDTFEQLWMVTLSHLGISLYYIYLSFAIVSLYLSLLGSYIFIRNTVILIHGRNQNGILNHNNSLTLSIVILFSSILLSMNPFFANNFNLGVGFILFLSLSLAMASEAIKFSVLDKRMVSLVTLTSFLLIFGYYGYILIPVYFAIIFLIIIIPASYRVVPITRPIYVLIVSEILFFVFSGSAGFITGSLSGSAESLFPFFRPLNLEHEYSLLSTSSIFRSIAGLSFNVGFSSGQLLLIGLFIIVLIAVTLVLYILFAYISCRKKPLFLLLELFIVINMSFPYTGNLPVIALIPVYLISSHIVTYNHLGEILSIFDANRFLLFPYWFLLPVILATVISFVANYEKVVNGNRSSYLAKHQKKIKNVFRVSVIVFCLTILILASYSVFVGPYNYLNLEKNSPTYAYTIRGNDSYNRMLLYQNANIFYPGNIYPSWMQMQADIPDKPTYINFLNMESSPLVSTLLNALPPASFIYSNGTEKFLHGSSLANGYKVIKNSNANVTVGYPIFVLGSQYTFDRYIFHNYYKNINATTLTGYSNASMGDGRCVYYSIPSDYIQTLERKGGMVDINTNIRLLSAIKNGTAYTFGLSNESQYYPGGSNELSFGIGSFNKTSSTTLLGSGNPISNDFNYSEYLSIGNAHSYDLENYIPFQGNDVGNVSIIFYNSGTGGIYGFIDYGGQWYQSETNYSVSQIRYFYSQAYLDSTNGINYNITFSRLIRNNAYQNLIPIYYDSPFGNERALINSIKYSDLMAEGKNYHLSDLVGSFLVNSANSTLINPSAYSIEQPQNGWYQVFSDGAAQSSFSAEYIPPVLDPPVYGYGTYTGFAQSVVENSTFTVPIGGLNSGEKYLDINLLFSPAGGDLNITSGGKSYLIDTRSNSSYYGWVGFNISGNIGKLKIRDVTGIQSLNQIVSASISSYKYFLKLALSLNLNNNFTSLSSLPPINVISTSYKTGPVNYGTYMDINNKTNVNIILEYSNPTYSNFLDSSTNSESFLLSSWASFPAIMIHNITARSLQIKFFESNVSYYSGYLPFVEFQGIWLPFLVSFVFKKKSVKLVTRIMR